MASICKAVTRCSGWSPGSPRTFLELRRTALELKPCKSGLVHLGTHLSPLHPLRSPLLTGTCSHQQRDEMQPLLLSWPLCLRTKYVNRNGANN